jgi:DNA replication licensing factor MCM4
LIITALQAAATDPTTGRLDLDLLQTGISQHSRSRRGDIRLALTGLIEKLHAPSIKFMDAFRQFKAQSDEVKLNPNFDLEEN